MKGEMQMKLTSLTASVVGSLLLSAGLFSSANADTIPYPNIGVPNPVTYDFTATVSGDIIAYFAGSNAADNEYIGLLVNGVSTGLIGLDNQTSTVGESFDLGFAAAGSKLTLVDYDGSTKTWYSNPSLNVDGGNHVYSAAAAAGQLYSASPAGTYLGFEDEPFPGSDYDYNDDTFVLLDVSVSQTPLPPTWTIMLIGLAGFAFLGFRRGAKGAQPQEA
jgi:hypothetical protein